MEQSQPPPPLPSGGRHHSYLDVIDQPSPQLGRRLHGLDADDFLSTGRTTKMRPAVTSLINTVVGGGTLSLAYSFQKAGAVLGTILLALICLGTDMTLFCLISASRRTGAKSYEGVMMAAFGRPAQVLCTVLIFIITFLTPVAYLILLRGLLAPIIEAYITHAPLSALAKHLVIGALALLVTPMSTFNMGSIGSLAVLSMAAIVVLAAVVGLRGYECMLDRGNPALPAVGTDHFGILSSIPIYVSAFLCHFNLLPLYSELRRPTRERAHNLVHFTMGSVLALYLWVGLMGYAYAECRSGSVPDNLLNAFPPDDPLVNVARAALSVVLCFCFPLLLMPCRDSLIRLLDMCAPGTTVSLTTPPPSVRTPLLPQHEQQQQAAEEEGGQPPSPYGATVHRAGNGAREERPLPSVTASSFSLSEASPPRARTGGRSGSSAAAAVSCLQRLLLTYLLVLIIVTLAVVVDSVALIWAVIGSFGCIFVGFVMPPAAYLKVGCRQQRLKRVGAWVILCLGAVLLVVCVTQTVFQLAS